MFEIFSGMLLIVLFLVYCFFTFVLYVALLFWPGMAIGFIGVLFSEFLKNGDDDVWIEDTELRKAREKEKQAPRSMVSWLLRAVQGLGVYAVACVLLYLGWRVNWILIDLLKSVFPQDLL